MSTIEVCKQAAHDAVSKLAAQQKLDSKTAARMENVVLQELLDKTGQANSKYVTDSMTYLAEYNANPHYAKMGMTAEDYVKTRRVDDGLEVLRVEGDGADNQSQQPAGNIPSEFLGTGQPGQVGSEIF